MPSNPHIAATIAALFTLSACASVNHDLANAGEAKMVTVDGQTWAVNVREEDNAIWIQNSNLLGALASGPTRPDAQYMKIARMHVPEGCKIVYIGDVQTNSREALYEC